MRIAIFTEIFDCGGIDTFIANLINAWPAKGDSFVIIANSNYPGLKIIEDRLNRPCEVIRHDIFIYSNMLSGSSYLKVIKKAISPVFRYLLILYNIVAFRKLLLQAKSDVLMVVNGGYPGGDSCRAVNISWGIFTGKPSVHNYHNVVMKSPWYQAPQEYLVDWLVSKYASQFVTVSRAVVASMSLRPLIARRSVITHIYNGLEINPVTSAPAKTIREEIGISSVTPLCLMLGTYEKRKGHYFLLSAFKKVLVEVPDARLLICGYGFPHEIRQVTKYVNDLCLNDRVHLMDFRTDASHLLRNADILVIASQAYESFGYTGIEAMAQRVPVVATNVGGIPEVVVNDEGGYCVDKSDVDAYARRIIQLLKDESMRREQGERGYKRYRKLFTADKMSSTYADMIYTLANITLPVHSR